MTKIFGISKKKRRFLFRNLGKGLLWFAALVLLFVLAKKFVPIDDSSWLNKLYEKPILVYFIFLVSEIVVGIIPPEMFMIWALKSTSTKFYVVDVVLLSSISYLAGVAGYFIGNWFHGTRFYNFIHEKFLFRYERFLRKYGGFLVIVAAATPLPFSGICMLVGAVQYKLGRFLLFAATRFLRFGVYAYVIWQANSI